MTVNQYRNICGYFKNLIEGTEWDNHLYAVGGCCRDLMLGKTINDIDLVVDLPEGGIRFANWLYENGLTYSQPVIFKNYGTAMVHLRKFPGHEIEIVQTRKEPYERGGGEEQNQSYGTLREDGVRRDLTVNALYYDISREVMIDVLGISLDDLHSHILRTPRDAALTFEEDPARMLRIIRMAARTGWEIPEEMYSALREKIQLVRNINDDRKKFEIEKMLLASNPSVGLDMMRDLGIIDLLAPELEETVSIRLHRRSDDTVWTRMLKLIDAVDDSLESRYAILFLNIGRVAFQSDVSPAYADFKSLPVASERLAMAALRKMRYSESFRDRVRFLLRFHISFQESGNNNRKLRDTELRRLQMICKGRKQFDRIISFIDQYYCADNNNPEYFKRVISKRVDQMEKEGSALFNYKMFFNEQQLMRWKNLESEAECRDCMEYFKTILCANPLRPKEKLLMMVLDYVPGTNPPDDPPA